MDFSLLISEIKSFQSSLVDLSKSYDTLPDKELNKSLGSRSLDNYKEGILSNKENGLRREVEFSKELSEKYPESKGYEIVSESFLRDADGNFVKDEFDKFEKISISGINSGFELNGLSKSYTSAMPGRIIIVLQMVL